MYENFAPETAKGNLLSCLGWTDGVDGVLDTQMVVGGECLQRLDNHYNSRRVCSTKI